MTAPTPAIPGFTNGNIVTQTDLNALSVHETNLYNWTMGGFRTQKPLAVVRQTTGVAIATSTDTQLVFQTEDKDYDNMFDPSAGNNNKFTVKTAGLYRILLTVHWPTTSATGSRFAGILVNGLVPSTDSVARDFVPGSTVNDGPVNVCEAVVSLAVNATVNMFAWQNSGVSLTPLTTTYGGTRASIEWISP